MAKRSYDNVSLFNAVCDYEQAFVAQRAEQPMGELDLMQHDALVLMCVVLAGQLPTSVTPRDYVWAQRTVVADMLSHLHDRPTENVGSVINAVGRLASLGYEFQQLSTELSGNAYGPEFANQVAHYTENYLKGGSIDL